MKKYCFIIILFGLITTFISCKKEKQKVTQTKVEFTKEGELSIFNTENDTLKVKLDIEIADTDFDIQTGLMYRDSMNKKQGMLFVFQNETPRFFYMKNTRIPLDIIYIDSKKHIVSFQKNAQPFNETSLPSNKPAKYVLEINGGLSDSWNLKVGDSISF